MKEQLEKDFDNIIKSLSLSQKDIEIKKFYLDNFINRGFPNRKEEDWKFSDLNSILSKNFNKIVNNDFLPKETEFKIIDEFEHNFISLLNGKLISKDFSYEEKNKILSENVSKKILPILRKIVISKEGTASLANVEGYEIGGKTGTANKSFLGDYSNKKINTFVSVFPITKPKYILAVMLDEPKINDEYIYKYRDGSGFELKGSPRNTAGWNSVETTGHIIEKIGPILATKFIEIK